MTSEDNVMAEHDKKLALLHQGQEHLGEKIEALTGTVGDLAKSLSPLAAYLASHDALDERVKAVEERMDKRKQETDPVIQWAYKAMGAAAICAVLGGYFLKDLFDSVAHHETRISVLEARK